jgi:4,5-dihydroxyphthalate decarboxylase
LFPNYREEERAYYEKTRIYPIMHVMGVRKDVAEAHPWLPGSVYKAFCEAKAIATKELVKVGSAAVTVPWPEVGAQDAIKVMGKDFGGTAWLRTLARSRRWRATRTSKG